MSHRREFIGAAGAALATIAAESAQAGPETPDADTLYGHGMVWNRELPGLAGRLNLAFDLRINLKTGTGSGSAGDPAYPGEGFHFSIEQTQRERVRGEQRFVMAGTVTDTVNQALFGLPVRIAAQTQGDATAIVIRVGDAVYSGAGLVVIAIIAILLARLNP